MISHVQRFPASGVRSFGRVQPRVCFISRKVCSMSNLRLDDVVHQRTRLGLLVVLAEVHQADFAYLKARPQLTDGNLGEHIGILAHHNLVSVRKGYEGRRPRRWISISRAGREDWARFRGFPRWRRDPLPFGRRGSGLRSVRAGRAGSAGPG
ncbi:transcriptional regulator, partial [Streptomyces sp. TUS-ST3]|uniref:transcriptional regulator n=1 Tax=Streptomyces sp. TUS-ST3 TaxID=3025591 RepID=UPI0032EA2292